MAHKITDKIKHFLHHDSEPAQTTPDGSPGYANVETPTTTNIPEAFFPGSKPVVPGERHSTDPYSSALGEVFLETKSGIETFDLNPSGVVVAMQNQAPHGKNRSLNVDSQQSASVPSDPEAMMGAPPSGKNSEAAQPEESTQIPAEEQQQDGVPPSKDTGTESEVQTNEPESDVQKSDYSDPEPKPQTEDYSAPAAEENSADLPSTDVDSKDSPADSLTEDNPEEKSEPNTDEKFADSPNTPENEVEERVGQTN